MQAHAQTMTGLGLECLLVLAYAFPTVNLSFLPLRASTGFWSHNGVPYSLQRDRKRKVTPSTPQRAF